MAPRSSIVRYEMQRVESSTPGADERLRRARLEAQRAGAALVERRRVDLERQAADDLAEKQPRAELGVDDAGVLADPADARVLRVDALLHRAGVDVGARLERLRCRGAHPREQRVEPRADHVVIVVAPGVARDLRATRIGALGRVRPVDVVDRPRDDDGSALKAGRGARRRGDRRIAADRPSRPRSPRSSHSWKNRSSGRSPAGAMPHRSNPRRAGPGLDGCRVVSMERGSSSRALRFFVQRLALSIVWPTSCRSTYGRMPPCRNATSSSGVSMRASAWNSIALSPSPIARTVMRPPGRSPCAMPVSSYRSRPVSPSDAAVAPLWNCSGSTPMFTRLLRWIRSKLSAMTALTPSSSVPFAAQSRDDPGSVFLARDDEQRHAGVLVFHRGVVDRHHVAVRLIRRPAAFGAGRELIAQPDVGERAAHHHFVIAAPRAVRVEVLRLHAVLHQILPRRAVLLDRAGRRDVIGRDAVAEQRQHARAGDVRRAAPAASSGPRRTAGCGCRSNRAPRRSGSPVGTGSVFQRSSPLKTSAYCSRNISEVTDAQHRLLNLALGRPEVAQIDRLRRPGRCRAARSSDRASCARRARRRRRAAATRGSSRAPAAECGPSKLRLPLSTDATTRLRASTSADTSSGSGPLLPMHVVQP